jgi:hypothetical protein
MLANAERRERLHRLIVGLLGHGQQVLSRWSGSARAPVRRSSIAMSSSTLMTALGSLLERTRLRLSRLARRDRRRE